ncbi:MAG: hypothetical protein ACYDAJ_04870 [Nitrosotalea sp.]
MRESLVTNINQANFNSIKSIYKKFGYIQRIYVKYTYTNVEGFKLGTDSIRDEINFQGHSAQKKNFSIERTVSLESMNCKNLTSSILEELTKAYNGAVNVGSYDSYVEGLQKEF